MCVTLALNPGGNGGHQNGHQRGVEESSEEWQSFVEKPAKLGLNVSDLAA
jgi:hypothetical protein